MGAIYEAKEGIAEKMKRIFLQKYFKIICFLLVIILGFLGLVLRNINDNRVSEINIGQTYVAKVKTFSWSNTYLFCLNSDGSFVMCEDNLCDWSKEGIVKELDYTELDYVTRDYYYGHYTKINNGYELNFEKCIICDYWSADDYINDNPNSQTEYDDVVRLSYSHKIQKEKNKMILLEQSPEGNDYRYQIYELESKNIDIPKRIEEFRR